MNVRQLCEAERYLLRLRHKRQQAHKQGTDE
jgi:hypothetical protein